MNRQQRVESIRLVPGHGLMPSKSAEVLPHFNAKTVYTYLNDNALPIQNSPFNTLSFRPNSNVTPRQVLYQPQVTPRQTQNYFVQQKMNAPQKVLINSNSSSVLKMANKTYDLPKQQDVPIIKIMRDEQLQVQERKVSTSSQTTQRTMLQKQIQHTPETHTQITQTTINSCDMSTQTEPQKISLPIGQVGVSLITPSFHDGHELASMKSSVTVPSMFKLRLKDSTHSNNAPRMAESMVPGNDKGGDILMQLLFLADPHAFNEVEQLMEFKAVRNLVDTLSSTLDNELSDVDNRAFVEKQAEVNGRVRITLKLCSEVLNKILEAIGDGDDVVPRPQETGHAITSQSSSIKEYKAPWDASNASLENSPFFDFPQRVGFIQTDSRIDNVSRQWIQLSPGNDDQRLQRLIEEARNQADISNPLSQQQSSFFSTNKFE